MNLNSKVKIATKWSVITELVGKLVSPISIMILARLLTPDAFGVLVTSTMVISFAEIFTDAGFQKYLIQNQFENDDVLFKTTAVAFWSNLIMSLFLWLVIAVFSSQIASWVGSEGYGLVIIVSCGCIPLAAFSSIQMALFKRLLEFKTLFLVRIVGILIPLVVTIPLAFVTRSFWSLIIGMLAREIVNAIILTIKSPWKPSWFYDWNIFKAMISFSIWSMIESISIWLTGYLDVFIVGSFLSTHYVGVYKTSINTVGQIMAIVTASTTPVLFSALSRLQDNEEEFKALFFQFQKIVGLIVIPMGVGIFLFSKTITLILLGEQWIEAANFIGWWGITSSVAIVLSYFCSEVYRAKGKPKLSVLAQFLHIIFLVPTVFVAIQYGFETLCVSRSLIRFQMILVNLIIIYHLIHISAVDMFKNIGVSVIASILMIFAYIILPSTESLCVNIVYMVLCSFVYLFVLCFSTSEREILFSLKNLIIKK